MAQPLLRIPLLLSVVFALNCVALAESQPPWIVGKTEPAWSKIQPQRTLRLLHDAKKTDQENGFVLINRIEKLQPGDMLIIGSGRYSIASKFNIELQGTASNPIWIVGSDPNNLPIITRPDARQNVINIGERSTTQYLCLRHLELTGGSTLIRFYDCHHLWLDQCHLHHAGAEGITTNTRDTSHLFITRNHFHDFKNPHATGEAMYLGANHGKAIMSYSVIAENHVHNCGGKQGDGIELKQGSHHNWILRNHVHDTNYPCILVYGTSGNGVNLIEQNVCYRSNDSALQVQGEAIIRNNLLISPSGFASTDHQGKTSQITFVHNTIISRRRGANLSSWNHREGMIFANNAIYTERGDALRFPQGSSKVTLVGNVVVGKVSGTQSGFVQGKDLSDFRNVTWDGSQRDASPRKGSVLVGHADPKYLVPKDIKDQSRGPQSSVGAFEVVD